MFLYTKSGCTLGTFLGLPTQGFAVVSKAPLLEVRECCRQRQGGRGGEPRIQPLDSAGSAHLGVRAAGKMLDLSIFRREIPLCFLRRSVKIYKEQ